LLVHQADGVAVDGRAAIKIDTLDERTGTVAHPYDGDADFSHWTKRNPTRSSEVGARYKIAGDTIVERLRLKRNLV
jgi:hypothetical protein